MRSRVFHSRESKKMMAMIVTLSLLVLALPCNCMAMEDPKPVEKEHPCHSSSDSSSNDTGEHDNCCCDGGDYTLLSEVGLSSLKTSTVEPENKTWHIAYSLTAFLDLRVFDAGAIRGSPPTDDVFTLPSKTFLAFLQRWLI